MTSRNTIVNEFTKTTIEFIKYAGKLFKNVPSDMILNKIKVGKRMDHEIVITEVGPYLFKYRDLISDRDGVEDGSEARQKLMAAIDKAVADEHGEVLNEIFNALFIKRDELSCDSRSYIYDTLDTLLTLYLDFIVVCRTEKKK